MAKEQLSKYPIVLPEIRKRVADLKSKGLITFNALVFDPRRTSKSDFYDPMFDTPEFIETGHLILSVEKPKVPGMTEDILNRLSAGFNTQPIDEPFEYYDTNPEPSIKTGRLFFKEAIARKRESESFEIYDPEYWVRIGKGQRRNHHDTYFFRETEVYLYPDSVIAFTFADYTQFRLVKLLDGVHHQFLPSVEFEELQYKIKQRFLDHPEILSEGLDIIKESCNLEFFKNENWFFDTCKRFTEIGLRS